MNPTHCPGCNEPLVTENGFIELTYVKAPAIIKKCPNRYCQAIKITRLVDPPVYSKNQS
jgi:hypothetical protein